MKRWSVFFLVLSLMSLAILPACGDDGDDKISTPIFTVTTTATATAVATPTPSPESSKNPVKIGAITAWSGPTAVAGVGLADPVIQLAEKQVKDMGGILGGREIKVVKYDNRGNVAEAVAGANKLLYNDKVSALIFGGTSAAEQQAVSDFAEENNILYVQQGSIINPSVKKFTLSATFNYTNWIPPIVDITTKVLKAKTVAFLSTDMTDFHDRVRLYKEGMEPVGIKTVYEDYTFVGTQDYMSYLTKIKYEKPDVLVLDQNANEAYAAVAKQIMDLGGWGDIKVITIPGGEFAKTRSGAQGWYVLAMWVPDLPYPGSVKYIADYQAMHGKIPSATQVYYYNCVWTAVHAIDLAGTDTDLVKIAQTARFSGKLQWETPMGFAHYTPDSEGYPGLKPTMTQVKDNTLVAVRMPE